MDFFAALRRMDRFAAPHLSDEIVPTAVAGGMGQAINAGRPQGADRPILAESEAVDELLEGGLVRSVVTCRPQRMRFVQGAVAEDDLMHGAGGDEDEARHAGRARRLK